MEIVGDFDFIDRLREKQVIQEKIDLAEQRTIESGKAALYGVEKLFENERAVVVLVSSPKAADLGADHFLVKEDHVCVSLSGGAKGSPDHPSENAIDFSVLEGRKVLVWGDHNDTGKAFEKEVCDQLREYPNMAVKSVDHEFMDKEGIARGWTLADDFSKSKASCGFYTCTSIEEAARKEIGDWENVDNHYKALDKERGPDIDRGMER